MFIFVGAWKNNKSDETNAFMLITSWDCKITSNVNIAEEPAFLIYVYKK